MVFRVAQTTMVVGYLVACGAAVNAQISGLPSTPGGSEVVAFFSGNVILPDGSRPPTSVLIQQVCSGAVTGTAWTDATGHFSFMIGGGAAGVVRNDTTYDPSMPAYFDRSTRGPTPYANSITNLPRDCEVQAVLAGFRSDHLGIAVRTAMDNNRVGTIVLHPLTKATALTVSATTLQAPPRARKAYEKGMTAMKERKWHSAEVDFHQSVAVYPQYALAWYELGLALQAENDAGGAVDAWKHSLASDEHYVSPYERLCELAYQKSDWNGLAEYSANWIHLNSEDFPAAYLYRSFADAKLNKIRDAEAMAREGLRLDREHRFPRISFMLGFALLEERQYAESAKYLRAYLEMAPKAADAAAVREQLALLDQATAIASSADGPAKH